MTKNPIYSVFQGHVDTINKSISEIQSALGELKVSIDYPLIEPPDQEEKEFRNKMDKVAKKILKPKSTSDKIFGAIDKISETLGVFTGVKELAETLFPPLNPTEQLKDFLGNPDAGEPGISTQIIQHIKDEVIGSEVNLSNLYFASHPLRSHLIGILEFIKELPDGANKTSAEKKFSALNEFLHYLGSEINAIIRNKHLPTISKVTKDSATGIFTFKFECPDSSHASNHSFEILRTDIPNDIIDILTSALTPVDIDPILTTTDVESIVNNSNFVLTSNQLSHTPDTTTYQYNFNLNIGSIPYQMFTAIFIQLFIEDSPPSGTGTVIHNVITAFDYNTETNTYDSCQLSN